MTRFEHFYFINLYASKLDSHTRNLCMMTCTLIYMYRLGYLFDTFLFYVHPAASLRLHLWSPFSPIMVPAFLPALEQRLLKSNYVPQLGIADNIRLHPIPHKRSLLIRVSIPNQIRLTPLGPQKAQSKGDIRRHGH